MIKKLIISNVKTGEILFSILAKKNGNIECAHRNGDLLNVEVWNEKMQKEYLT